MSAIWSNGPMPLFAKELMFKDSLLSVETLIVAEFMYVARTTILVMLNQRAKLFCLEQCTRWEGFPGGSAGKESTCNAWDPNSIPGLERSAGEGISCPLQDSWASLCGLADKESACNARGPNAIPGLERSAGEGISCPLQYSWSSLCGSVGKESACNGRGPSAIPGLERSPGEGINCPLQYSWASLVAQLVKNPPAMQETWV